MEGNTRNFKEISFSKKTRKLDKWIRDEKNNVKELNSIITLIENNMDAVKCSKI